MARKNKKSKKKNNSYIGFKPLVTKLQKDGHSKKSAEAIAASIGRKKYGKKKFQSAAAKGKSLKHSRPMRN